MLLHSIVLYVEKNNKNRIKKIEMDYQMSLEHFILTI